MKKVCSSLVTIGTLLFALQVVSIFCITNLYAEDTWEYYDKENSGLARDAIECMEIDNSGNVWIGTWGGISILHNDGSWTNYTKDNSDMTDNHILSIVASSNGNIWIGTDKDGVFHINQYGVWTNYNKENSGLYTNRVNTVSIAFDGIKWFGMSFGGVNSFTNGGEWTHYDHTNSDMASNIVISSAIDGNNNKWFGTAEGVSMLGSDGFWTNYDSTNSTLGDGQIECIAVTPNGEIWCGNYVGGISILHSDGTWGLFTDDNSDLTSNMIKDFEIASNGDIWIATWYGISVYHTGGYWTSYTEDNSGLHHNKLEEVEIGLDNSVWFGGEDDGISVLKQGNGTTPTPTPTFTGTPTPSATPSPTPTSTPVKSVQFGLGLEPEKASYESGDTIELRLNLQTPSKSTNLDLYFVLLNPLNELFFGLNWNKTPATLFSNFNLPGGIKIDDAPLMSITIPSTKPPISAPGIYTFAIAGANPGTLDFISSIGSVVITIDDESEPEPGDEKTFDEIEFIYIPGGIFTMGVDGSYWYEGPAHEVTITKDFWLSKYEITQKHWVDVMGSNPSLDQADENYPVEQVSWDVVQDFIAALGNNKYRLPTEAEWEYACRAGTSTVYFFGDDYTNLDDYAWHWFNGAEMMSHAVGLKQPNPWGLYDILGNVWEWCSDWYSADYYSTSPVVDPEGPSEGTQKVRRGGSWGDGATYGRSSYRSAFLHSDGSRYIGFRLLREK